MPFRPAPVPAELRRPSRVTTDEKGRPAFTLYPRQQRDYDGFLQMGALSHFVYPQCGKSFLPSKPAVIWPVRSSFLRQGGRSSSNGARLDLYLQEDAAAEVVVSTLTELRRHLPRAIDLEPGCENHR